MKNLTWKTRVLIAINVIALLSATSAYAQTSSLRAHIPFQFLAGSMAMPAGEYQVDVSSAVNRITLRLLDGGAGLYLPALPTRMTGAADQPATLVFHKYGNRHFLWKVSNPDASQAYQVPASKVEREMARTEKAHFTTEIASIRAWSK